MKVSEMTGNQRVAYGQVVAATNWVVGGYENAVEDGHMEKVPTHQELAEEIYQTVMTCTTLDGGQIMYPAKEIRFAGEKWIRERIEKRLAKEGY